MSESAEPIVLELAGLPREQVGPFLLLGLDKTAERPAVDAHWADRIKRSRKGQVKVPLEDVNWARDQLAGDDAWVRADAASLNADTCEAVVADLLRRFGGEGGQPTRLWQPLDGEKDLSDYNPPADVPDPESVRAALAAPEIPQELPAAGTLLAELARQPIDPWGVDLPLAD
jgi:hypothetical protein